MKKILLFASLLAASMSVSAATLTGTSSGIFTNPTGPSTSVTSGVNTSHFAWGEGAKTGRQQVSSWGCGFIGLFPCFQDTYSDPSSLTYTGGNFSGEVGEYVNVGKIKFHNGTILAGTEATGVDFALTLDFATPFSEVTTFTYNFGLENTPNPNGDSVTLVGGDPTKFFSHEGQDYYFTLLGFKVGQNVVDEIFLKELKSGTFNLVGKFTTLPSEVPLPAAVWLFASGLMGFMAIRRRAKAQQAA